MTHDQPVEREAAWTFLAPRTLEATPQTIDRILLIGQCLVQPWIGPIETLFSPGTKVDFILFNHAVDLPEPQGAVMADYDFQVVSLPLRIMIPETLYLGLDYSDTRGVERLFDEACERLDVVLDLALKWTKSHGLLTFVANALVPQQNPCGRLLPRYDLRNMVFFIERLNQHLAARVATYDNAFLLDVDAIAASLGRRYVQDDALWIHSHSSLLYDHDIHADLHRIEPPPHPASVEFGLKTEVFIGAVWRELMAMTRTLRQTDPVKMVIVDLDDTLWRGVLAEQDALDKADTEGWPLGVVEALMYLKRRGIILAIASKNEEGTVARIFQELYAFRIALSDFAIKRINWRQKPDNIAEILEEANLLPRNVVFIDDNPVERDAVAQAFPEMRILGASLYAIRRDLMWSPETQVASITRESERRSDMIQAQVRREGARKIMPRAAFLASLDTALRLFAIGEADTAFARALEILNKTNQFNTTGVRWREDTLRGRMRGGLRVLAFSAGDRFTDYGLVGVLLLEADTILQFVMSCRVFGLDVEMAVVAQVAAWFRGRGLARIEAKLVETSANMPCRDLYRKCGFRECEAGWIADTDALAGGPPHVTVSIALEDEASAPADLSLRAARLQLSPRPDSV